MSTGLRSAFREVGAGGLPLTSAAGMTDPSERAAQLALMLGIMRARERGLFRFAAALEQVMRGEQKPQTTDHRLQTTDYRPLAVGDAR